MYKVLIWGIDVMYDDYKNNIDFEILKGNFEIVAMVSKDRFCDFKDGIKVIGKEEISSYKYDYIVIFSSAFKEIKQNILQMGIDEKCIIDGEVFKIPYFDFNKYVSLIENPVTIVSDDCWGGYVYKYLHLKATSPFVNIWISNKDFIKLLKNFEYYMTQSFAMEREGDMYEGLHPVASLGKGKDKIYINCIHHANFNAALKDWEKRKSRINFDRLFIKMAVPVKYYMEDRDIYNHIEEFNKLDFKTKICFHPSGKGKNIISLPRQFYASNTNCRYTNFIDEFARDIKDLVKQIDILKLLCGETNYIRERLQ